VNRTFKEKKPFEVDKRHLVSHTQTIPNCDLTEREKIFSYTVSESQKNTINSEPMIKIHQPKIHQYLLPERERQRESVRKISESVPKLNY
jgi:hypothetical protein